MPFTGGGVNWGGLAVDGGKGVVYVNSSNLVHRVTLFPAADYAQMKQRFPDKEVSPQRGAPYGMKRELLVSPLGLPCNPPPWGVLTALDLGNRKILWQVPLGTTEELNPLGLARRLGTAHHRRPARHRERPHLHRRRARRLSARLRREDRRRALDRPPALRRHRHPDQLSLAGPPICRDRRRRPWRSRRPGRRHAGRLRPASALASPAPRPGCAGSTSRAGVSSCMPGWPEPSCSRWRRCGGRGGAGDLGGRTEQPSRAGGPPNPFARPDKKSAAAAGAGRRSSSFFRREKRRRAFPPKSARRRPSRSAWDCDHALGNGTATNRSPSAVWIRISTDFLPWLFALATSDFTS